MQGGIRSRLAQCGQSLVIGGWLVCAGNASPVWATEPPAQPTQRSAEEVRKMVEARRRELRESIEEMENRTSEESVPVDSAAFSPQHARARMELVEFMKEAIPTAETASPRCDMSTVQIPRVERSGAQVCVAARVLCDEKNLSGILTNIIRKPDLHINGLGLTQQVGAANFYRFEVCKDVSPEGGE